MQTLLALTCGSGFYNYSCSTYCSEVCVMALWKDPSAKDSIPPVRETFGREPEAAAASVIEKANLEKVSPTAPLETRKASALSTTPSSTTPSNAKESIIAS